MNEHETNAPIFNSVWDALADTPEAATNLRLRSEVMRQINALIESQHLTQTQAAQQCGITQPRMNDLLQGKISKFSLDALVNIATAAGWVVHLELETA